MQKALSGMCAAVLLLGLANGPALAGKLFQSKLLCNSPDGTPIPGGKGSVKVNKKSGDVKVAFKGVRPNTDVFCNLLCGGELTAVDKPCGATDSSGKYKTTLKNFINRGDLGPRCSAVSINFFGLVPPPIAEAAFVCSPGFDVPE